MVTKKVKITFSIISVFLMVPTIAAFNKNATDFDNFYRTLFVFYIDEVVAMFADDELSSYKVVAYWEIANQWLGALVCAVSFSMLMDSFNSIITSNVSAEIIQICMLGIVFSGIACAVVKDIIQTFRRKMGTDRMNRQVSS